MRQRRRIVRVSAIVTSVLLLGSALWILASSRSFQLLGRIVPRIPTGEKVVAITFDDGPTPKLTREIVRILGEMNVQATFFVNGRTLENNPDEGRRLVLAGHELGNHGYSHRVLMFKTPRAVGDEIRKTDRLIRLAGHKGEIFVRPPYALKLLSLPYWLGREGRATVTWDVGPDFRRQGVDEDRGQMIDFAIRRARPGSIILMHVISREHRESMKSIRGIITGLRTKGYRFVTLSQLMAMGKK